MTSRKFNSNQQPDRHVRGADIPLRKSLPRQDRSAITLLAYGNFSITKIIFGYIKVDKRIIKAHKDMFTDKTMVLWYKGRPIIGTMHDGLWYQQDLNGMCEQLMFQSEVTHVSFLPSPHEDRERKNPSHHR